MPIIIDTNCLANVFNRSSDKHSEYEPVLDWILSGKGLVVLGGTKYLDELKSNSKYLKIISYLKDLKKVLMGDQQKIDELQAQIEEACPDPDFDDPHLVAIVIDTKCQIICSEDKRSISFVKKPELYPKGMKRPVYYTGAKNKKLLCDKYIHKDLLQKCNHLKTEEEKKLRECL